MSTNLWPKHHHSVDDQGAKEYKSPAVVAEEKNRRSITRSSQRIKKSDSLSESPVDTNFSDEKEVKQVSPLIVSLNKIGLSGIP